MNKVTVVIDATLAVVKRKFENSGLYGSWTHGFIDTSTALFHFIVIVIVIELCFTGTALFHLS